MTSFEALNTAIESLHSARAHLDEEILNHFVIKEIPPTPKTASRSSRQGTSHTHRTSSSKGGKRTAVAQSDGARELNRQLQTAKFHKELDDAQFRIDTKLRTVAALDNEDFDEQFGVERNKAAGLSLNIRTLEDRAMRAQAMLALEHYMGSFQGKKIHDELEAADVWFRSQAKKFRIELQAVGVDFDETDAPKVFLGEDAEPDDFYANDILDSEGATDDNMRATTASTSPRSRGTVRSRDASSRGSRWSEDDGTVPESVDTQSSHSILEGLIAKLKQAQEDWKLQTKTVINKLQSDLDHRATELKQTIATHEHDIAVLHRRSVSMDDGLSHTDEGKIRSSVDAKFQASQTRFEEKIQSQKERLVQVQDQVASLQKEIGWLQSISKAGENGVVSGKGLGASALQQMLTKNQASIGELKSQLASKKREVEKLALEADDSRDEMRSLQAKSKQMAADLEKIKSDQAVELKGLRYEYGLSVARTESAKAQCDEVEEKLKIIQKTVRGKARNTMRLSAVMKMNKHSGGLSSGNNSPKRSSVKRNATMRTKASSPGGVIPPGSPSNVGSPARVLSPGPGDSSAGRGVGANMQVEHENIWPRPAGGMAGYRPGSVEKSRSTLLSIQEGARGGSRGLVDTSVDDAGGTMTPSRMLEEGVGEEGFSDLEDEFFNEEEASDELDAGSMDEDSSSQFVDIESMYMPSALSNVCEGAYLKTAQALIDKKAADTLQASIKKKTGGKTIKKDKGISNALDATTEPVSTPLRTPLEGFEVFRSILEDLISNKYVEKTYVDELNDSLAITKRELPILPQAELETTLTRYCLSVCNHVLLHTPHLLVSQNKHGHFRKLVFHLLSLIGIVYECCHLTNDDCIVGFMPNPGIVKFMEEVSLEVIGNIVGGKPETVESEAFTSDVEESKGSTKKKSGKKKSNKKKGKKGVVDDGRCSTDPLHPRLVYKCVDIAVSEREFSLKAAGFLPSLEELRKWAREINHGKMKDSMDESWFNCSKLHSPNQINPMTSEERHLMCAYQIFFVHLASIGQFENYKGKYENMDPLVPLATRLTDTLKPSLKYDETLSDITALMKSVVPAAVPLIFTMEFARRIVDEDIIKRNMLIRIQKGEDPDLSFLIVRGNTPSSADDKRQKELKAKLKKEMEFLNGLPARERTYLLAKRTEINDMIQEILKLTEEDDEPEDENDEEDTPEPAIKLTKMLKKSLLSHLLKIEEKAVDTFSRQNLPIVTEEIEKFSSNLDAMVLIRNRTLDIGGKFTQPLRDKLEVLNQGVKSTLISNRELSVNVEMKRGELQTLSEIVEELMKGLEGILSGKITVVDEVLENLILESSPNSAFVRESRLTTHEQLQSEHKRLTAMVEKDQDNYDELYLKLQYIASAMSYSMTDAWNQGFHIISSLLRQLLKRKWQTCQKRRQSIMSVTLPSTVLNETSSSSSFERLESDTSDTTISNVPKMHHSSLSGVDTTELPDRLERVVMLIIDFLGMDALMNLGALYLDDSIMNDLSNALRQFLSSRDVKRKLLVKPKTGVDFSYSPRQARTGTSVLRAVDADAAANTADFAQLVTSVDIQNSVDSSTTKSASITGSGSRRMSNIAFMEEASTVSKPPTGVISKGRIMKSILGAGGAVPKKTPGPSLALIASGGGTVAPTYDRKSSIFTASTSRTSHGSFKSSRSSGKSIGSSNKSIGSHRREHSTLHMNSGVLSDTSSGVLMSTAQSASSTLSSLHNDMSSGDFIPAPPSHPSPRAVSGRGRLRATVSNLEGDDDSSVASLDSSK